MASVNNEFYDGLGDRWHTASSHPVALLRAENRLRNPWIEKIIPAKSKVLDIGCGAGFLTNYLAKKSHQVHGIDLSPSSLAIAKQNDSTSTVVYREADATTLPYQVESFDIVCAMDLLEHVTDPTAVIKEASRVLKPGGLFFFHTFNRNFWSYLIVIKGVEWCVKNTPPNLHIYPLFIKPKELIKTCKDHHLEIEQIVGVRPNFAKVAFWKMVCSREVPDNFEFKFTKSLTTGYSGYTRKLDLNLIQSTL